MAQLKKQSGSLLKKQSYDGKNSVPNLEAMPSDGKAIFTPRQWLERFGHFTKRGHKIDFAPIMKEEDITEWS